MKIASITLIILALVAGVLPHYTDCQSQGRAIELANGKTVPMKCHWTGEAEIATAGPVGLLGIMMFTAKRKETQKFLALMGMALGAFVILLPTALIGVCPNPDMICNSIMKPALILTGSLMIAANLFAFYRATRTSESAITEHVAA